MSALSIYAGPGALRHLESHGLDQKQISVMIGASGGPKWFVLYGLDRYLAGNFLAGRETPLALLGSSAGAWRLACYAQADPVAALERLAYHYSRQCYSASPSMQEVSREARHLLDIVLGETGAQEIARNPVFQLHVVADRARRLVSSENRRLLAAGLLLCGLSNALSRRNLRWYFERVIFYSSTAGTSRFTPTDLPTRYVPLQEANLRAALMASGSIPVVMEGVSDIGGAPAGIYRDGGITDYHFDMPFNPADGLVMYPHFYPHITAGWFDKMVPWRGVRQENFDRVLLLTPSREFVERLPYGKIPDRKDFEKLDDASRMRYWHKVLDESERLAADFHEILVRQRVLEVVQPLMGETVR